MIADPSAYDPDARIPPITDMPPGLPFAGSVSRSERWQAASYWGGSPEEELNSPAFADAARFGALDTFMLIAAVAVGAALDPHIEKATGAKGFGPLLGAVAGNTLAAGIGAKEHGWAAAAGVSSGALLALAPALVAMGFGRSLTGNTRTILLGLSAVGVGWAYTHKGPGDV